MKMDGREREEESERKGEKERKKKNRKRGKQEEEEGLPGSRHYCASEDSTTDSAFITICITICITIYPLHAVAKPVKVHPPLYMVSIQVYSRATTTLRPTLSYGFEESQNRRSVASRITLSGSLLMVDAWI